MADPHLLHFRVSHYNEKVRWALDFKGWPHTREALVPGFHVPRVWALTGQKKVPVLVLEDGAHCGSAKILELIEARRPDPPLFPEDPADRQRAVDLQAYFDDEVAPALRRLFWGIYLDRPADCAKMAAMGAPPSVETFFRWMLPIFRLPFRRNMGVDKGRLELARARLPSYVDRIESEIGPSGYLAGERFSVADLSVAAVMTALLRPPEFPYPLPEPWPPALVELKEQLLERPGCQWVMDIYRRHRGTSAELSR